MRNLTGVLEATVFGPSGKGPRHLTNRRPQRAREDSASTGNPLLITSTRYCRRGQNTDARIPRHHPRRREPGPRIRKRAGHRPIFTPSRRPRTGPWGLTDVGGPHARRHSHPPGSGPKGPSRSLGLSGLTLFSLSPTPLSRALAPFECPWPWELRRRRAVRPARLGGAARAVGPWVFLHPGVTYT